MKYRVIGFRVSEEEANRIDEFCKKTGRTKTDLMRSAMQKYLMAKDSEFEVIDAAIAEYKKNHNM